MSNESLIIPERTRDIGDFLVGRLLPFRKQRMIGPFIFLDHMGPTTLSGDKEMSVNQHPHIGLATLTYLLEGEVHHEDSIGTSQIIKPGAINWMVAGRGVTHTERTPEHLHNQTYTMNGYQIWVALPKEKEQMEPEFHHLKSNEIPTWTDEKSTFRLLAGQAFGRTSPLKVYSPLFLVEIVAEAKQQINLAEALHGEIGILVSRGSVEACDEKIEAGNLMYAKSTDQCAIQINAGSRIFILGGQPFNEPRIIDWNFVASDQNILNRAKEAWKAKTFPMMTNDSTYIPYPS
ncbi:pirin family protein [Crocinitomix algicola]|uniref:pirin family protein n=1 Tax=Crocinitomix algicola TaxID=1740263 RepID=UPI00082C143C|nr:pirin family protein [Crocinitomix algicola]